MVAVKKRINVGLVVAEQRNFLCERVNLVEVEIKHKNAIIKLMRLGFDPAVHHVAFVEAGVHHHTLLSAIDCATDRAESKASS